MPAQRNKAQIAVDLSTRLGVQAYPRDIKDPIGTHPEYWRDRGPSSSAPVRYFEMPALCSASTATSFESVPVVLVPWDLT